MKIKDKIGQIAYVHWMPDCDENAGGFYCEVYSNANYDKMIDNFCVHPGDFQPYFGSDFYDRLEEFISHHYENEILNLL